MSRSIPETVIRNGVIKIRRKIIHLNGEQTSNAKHRHKKNHLHWQLSSEIERHTDAKPGSAAIAVATLIIART
jgi:hypothetical protein